MAKKSTSPKDVFTRTSNPTEDIDLDLIGQDESVDPKVMEVYAVLKQYGSPTERHEWMEKRAEGWDAVGDNDMWRPEDKREMIKKGQVTLVINKISKGVQGASAVVTDSKPEVKFLPVGSGDLYIAELLKRAHDLVFVKNDGQDVVYDAVEEAKIGGIDFFKVWHDPAKGVNGRVMFEAIKDPTKLYWDRDSAKRDFSDTHIIMAQKRTRRFIKDTYPGITDDDLIFSPQVDDSTKSEGITGGDNYTETPDQPGGDKKKPFSKDIWEIEAWMTEKVKENIIIYFHESNKREPIVAKLEKGEEQTDEQALSEFKKQNPDVTDAEISNRTVEKRIHRIIVGKKLVSDEDNPFGIDSDGDPVIGIIPLKHSRTRTSYPTSPTFKALEINREKNKRRSQMIYLMAMEAASPIVEPAGCEWIGEPGTPGSRLKVGKNASFTPQRMTGGGINFQQLAQLEAESDRDIDDQYDLSEVMRGKLPPGQEGASGRLVLALQDTAGLMSKPFLRTLETSIVKLAKVNVSLILKHWTREQWERLLEKDELTSPPQGLAQNPLEGIEEGSPEEIDAEQEIKAKWLEALEMVSPLDPQKDPEISLIDLDVRMSVGSSLPTNRMAKANVAFEFVQAGIYDVEAALEYIDDPQKDVIAKRLKKNAELAAQQEQLK